MSLYRKNIGDWQQILRIALGAGVAAAALLWLSGPIAYAGAAAGIGLALTGFVGYCPACAILGVGRRQTG